MARVLTKYKPCLDPSEYNGFGYVRDNDGIWYKDVAVFADDFSDGDIVGWEDGLNTYNPEKGRLVKDVATSGSITASISIVQGKKYRVVSTLYRHGGSWQLYVGGGASGSTLLFNMLSLGTEDISVDFVGNDETQFILYGSDTAIDSYLGNIAIIPLNDDGSIDFSNATPVNNLGIVGKAYIDAGGNVETASEAEREMFFEYLKADKIKCNKLEFTPVVFSGYLTADASIGSIYQLTSVKDTHNAMVAGIYVVPEDGIYDIKWKVDGRKATTVSTDVFQVKLIVNAIDYIGSWVGLGTTTQFYGASMGVQLLELKKGDTINLTNISIGSSVGYAGARSPLTIQKIGE